MSDSARITSQRTLDSPTAPDLDRSARAMTLTSPISRFADGLLAADLPQLATERRHAAVAFIERRVAVLPSITRIGVLVIARTVDVAAAIAGQDRIRRIVVKLPLPLISEYPRLVRSLGFAYVWESWPDTSVDGGAPK